ncbi:MAG TPA: hypothetical protein VMV92_09010 [Streptosporangiaceae bacterium]|nr:hypothetical protein [Streptosporangiaceae bacterium]
MIDEIADPGGPQLNEDRVGSGGKLAWVIDGATSLETSSFLPDESDVQWLVGFVDRRLRAMDYTELPSRGDLILQLLRKRVTEELVSFGFPEGRIYPVCSVGICLDQGEFLELTRVGNVTCVVTGDRPVELSTSYFSQREASAVRRSAGRGLSSPAVRADILERRMEYILGVEGESVFSGHSQAGLYSHSIQIDRRDAEHVLVCSDGFARAVVDYGLYRGWRDLVADAVEGGLRAIVAKIRRFERINSGGNHFKRADDASALLAVV